MGAPPFVHTTCGRGLPCGRGRGEGWRGGQAGSALGSCPLPPSHRDPSPAHLEGDDEIEMLPDFADVSLAEVAGQPDLGLLWGHNPRGRLSVGLGDPPQRNRESGGDEAVGGGPNEDTALSGRLTHNLPDGDRLGQGGRLAAPRDVDPNDAEGDSRSGGEVLDREAAALHGLGVGRNPLVR